MLAECGRGGALYHILSWEQLKWTNKELGLEPMGTLVLESTQRERGLDIQPCGFLKPDLSNEHTALDNPHACRVSD